MDLGYREEKEITVQDAFYPTGPSYFILKREGKKEGNERAQGEECFNLMQMPCPFARKFSVPSLRW